MMTRDVGSLKVGRVAYSCWCDDAGRVVDDGTVARLDEEHYRVTAADPSLHWLEDCGRGMNVRLEDSSRRLAALALQGPTSRDVLRACARFDSGPDMDGLKFFGVNESVDRRRPGLDQPHRLHRRSGLRDLDGEPAGVGGLGRPHGRGTPFGIEPAGLDALDVTRIEAGFILLGHRLLQRAEGRPRGAQVDAARARLRLDARWRSDPGEPRELHRPRRHPRRESSAARPGIWSGSR
jgi:aminomethyltransferase